MAQDLLKIGGATKGHKCMAQLQIMFIQSSSKIWRGYSYIVTTVHTAVGLGIAMRHSMRSLVHQTVPTPNVIVHIHQATEIVTACLRKL